MDWLAWCAPNRAHGERFWCLLWITIVALRQALGGISCAHIVEEWRHYLLDYLYVAKEPSGTTVNQGNVRS